MYEISEDIFENMPYDFRGSARKIKKILERLANAVPVEDGVFDKLSDKETEELLKKKVDEYLSGLKHRLMKEYNMTSPRAATALDMWVVKVFIEAAMKEKSFYAVRQILYYFRYPELSVIYENYLNDISDARTGLTTGEKKKIIAEYIESITDMAKKELSWKYKLSDAQIKEAIDGWYIITSLKFDLEFADLDMAQVGMHLISDTDIEKLYLDYTGCSDALIKCKCNHPDDEEFTYEVRVEFIDLLRSVLFREYKLSKEEISIGIKKHDLYRKVLFAGPEGEYDTPEDISELRRIFQMPIYDLGREVAESVWEDRKYS